jgi:hypothetical protein
VYRFSETLYHLHNSLPVRVMHKFNFYLTIFLTACVVCLTSRNLKAQSKLKLVGYNKESDVFKHALAHVQDETLLESKFQAEAA